MLAACLASAATAAVPELRGTWVTTTGLSAGTVRTPAATAANFGRLRAIGLNTVYMDAWRNGYTYYKSDAIKAITGRELAPELGTRDLFGETLIQSHRNGMSQFAWLQYGFATQFLDTPSATTNPLSTHMKNRGWLLKDAAGAYTNSTNKFAWMNPLVPEVRELVIRMGVELVRKYDLDGIQFDDRLAWPTQFGYDEVTRSTYLSETGRALPTDPRDAAFVKWRSEKVTDFAKQFSTALRAANPRVRVAAAPGGYGNTYATYAVDAPTWSRTSVEVNGVTSPLFDEITPQIYSSLPNNFAGVWDQNLAALNPATRGSYSVGISINNSAGAPYDWATINKPQVDKSRATTGTAGHVWWYSAGVLEADEAQLTAYYDVATNGYADRPDRPAGWRPAPVVATAATSGKWTVTLAEPAERYQVIARTGDAWSVVLNTVLPSGAITLTTGGTYAAVELLVDRRGFIKGDLNFDNRVNFEDLVALAQNYNASGKLWTQGDFTLDGIVNFADLVVLAQHYGTGVAPGTQPSFAAALAMVPEPTSAALVMAAAMVMGRGNKNPLPRERGRGFA